MARPDPLEQDSLTPHRFGHCPALWLALPLLLGCAIDAAAGISPGPWLLVGVLAAGLGWFTRRHAIMAGIAIVIAGTAIGAAWHQLRMPPQTPATVRRPFVEIPILVEARKVT
jgi:hypothetical protein